MILLALSFLHTFLFSGGTYDYFLSKFSSTDGTHAWTVQRGTSANEWVTGLFIGITGTTAGNFLLSGTIEASGTASMDGQTGYGADDAFLVELQKDSGRFAIGGVLGAHISNLAEKRDQVLLPNPQSWVVIPHITVGFLFSCLHPARLPSAVPSRPPRLCHLISHTTHLTQLISHNSPHTTHLTQFISHHSSHTTHLTQLISHTTHLRHNSSHTTHLTQLISHHSSHPQLISFISHTTHLTHNSSHTQLISRGAVHKAS